MCIIVVIELLRKSCSRNRSKEDRNIQLCIAIIAVRPEALVNW